MVKIKSIFFNCLIDSALNKVFLLESTFEGKKFLLIVVIWFIVSYLILWFMGGACLNPINGQSCLASNALSALRGVPIIGLILPFDNWNSLMYFLAPIAGFVLAFFIINWWNEFFNTKEAASIWFVIIILATLLIGYYINLGFYVGETARLNSGNGVDYSLYFCFSETTPTECYSTVQKINNENISRAQKTGTNSVNILIPIDYWGELRKSIFLSFVLGAIAGWTPLFAQEIIQKRNKNHVKQNHSN